MSGRVSVELFLIVCLCIALEIQLSPMEVAIFCTCTKSEPGFPMSYAVMFFVFSEFVFG